MALITMYVMGACQRRLDNVVLVVILIRGAVQFVIVRQPCCFNSKARWNTKASGHMQIKIAKNSGLEQPWLETVLLRGFEVCSPFKPEKQFVCCAMYPLVIPV